MHDVLLCADIAKRMFPETVTVLGGHHVTLYPEESIKYPNVDFILQGEGEETIIELVDSLSLKASENELKKINGIGFYINNSAFINQQRAYIKDINNLLIPDRSFLPLEAYKSIVGRNSMLATIVSSRGCPFKCTFCYTPNKTYRSRTTKNIITEIKYLIDLGFKEIFFFDDLFALKAQQVIDFAKELKASELQIEWSFRGRISSITEEMLIELKGTGIHRIQFGIESGVDKTLINIKKGTSTKEISKVIKLCKKHNIQTIGNFMIGLPDETAEDIKQTLQFSRNIGLTYSQYSVLMPYPFTEIYERGLKEGDISYDFWKEFADNPKIKSQTFKMQYWTKEVSEEFLFKALKQAYNRFYFRPSVVWFKLKELRNFRELRNAIIGVLSLIKFNPKA